MRHVRALLAVLLVVATSLTSCTGGAGDVRVTVFAAASLTDAFADLAAVFEAAHPGVDVELNLATSSSLREQILAGAPADVFASASTADMDAVVGEGAVAAPPRLFARNQLQIAVPAGNPGGVTGLDDFADPSLLIGLPAPEATSGRYAAQALALAGVTPSVDSYEPDVRALLTKIEAGELDAGIVFVTDVTAGADTVEGIAIPSAFQVEAQYPIAVLADAPNAEMARAFVAFVLSPEGLRVLAAYGFLAP
jgi:molybdate transport system substrate-binding protein